MKIMRVLILVPCVLSAMEKNQTSFEFEKLPADMQQLIVVPPTKKIREIVQSSPSFNDAISQFKDYAKQVVLVLRTVSKSLAHQLGFADLKKIIFLFLNELSYKFPGQEVRAAYALAFKNNNASLEWLNQRRLQQNKPPISKLVPSEEHLQHALSYLDENDTIGLQQWLEVGYDPTGLLLPAINLGDLYALKLLVAYGADLQTTIKVGRSPKSLIAHVKYLIQDTDDEQFKEDYQEILRYLKDEGARE